MKEKTKCWEVADPYEPPFQIRRSRSLPKVTLLSTDGIEQSKLTFLAQDPSSKSLGSLGVPKSLDAEDARHKRRRSWSRTTTRPAPKLSDSISVAVDVLDFAGQKCYYSTHQLFLGVENALHVVVFDMSDSNCDIQIEYWLQSIYCAVPKAHIVCVGTHLDSIAQSRDEVGRWLEEKRLIFRKTFASFSTLRFAAVSLVSGENFDLLRRDLEHVIVSKTPFQSSVPKKFLILKELLANIAIKLEPPIITRFELEKYARFCDIQKPDDISAAAKMLHSTGSIMFFQSDRALGRTFAVALGVSRVLTSLSDIAILSPHWLMTIVSSLFSTSHNLAKDGVLKHSDLSFVWQAYPRGLFGHLLALLERFEVLYQLPVAKTAGSERLPRKGVRRLNSKLALDIIRGKAPLWEYDSPDDIDYARPLEHSDPERRNSTSTASLSTPDENSETPAHARPSNRLSVMLSEEPSSEEMTSAWAEWALNSPEFDESAVSLIPALLPHQEPRSALHSLWYSASASSYEQLDRSFRFRFLPAGFMSRLLARLFHHFSPLGYWREGILCKRTADDAVLVAARPLETGLSLLDVFVRASTIKAARGLFETVLGMVENLIHEWSSLEVIQSCRCPRCAESTTSEPGELALVELDLLVPKGTSYLTCSLGHEVAIDEVAPETSLAAFSGAILAMDDIKVSEVIGTGAFATVKRGKHKGHTVACKMLKLGSNIDPQTSAAKFREFRAEVNALSNVPRHPNILAPLALVLDPPTLVFEIVKGPTLFNYIQQCKSEMDWAVRISIVRQLTSSLRHLHSQEPEPVAHLDFKSPNIMLHFSDDPSIHQQVFVKVIDFGLATRVGPRKLRGRKVDNPVWLAPEILRNEPYDEKVDIYALGVILYELISFKQMFEEYSFFSDIEDAVCSAKRPPIPKTCPPMYTQLIQRCWDDNARRRPSFSWIESMIGKIESTVLGMKKSSQISTGNLLSVKKSRSFVSPSAQLRSKSIASFVLPSRTAQSQIDITVPVESPQRLSVSLPAPSVDSPPAPPLPVWCSIPSKRSDASSPTPKDLASTGPTPTDEPSAAGIHPAPSTVEPDRRPSLVKRIVSFFSKTQLSSKLSLEFKASITESSSGATSSSETPAALRPQKKWRRTTKREISDASSQESASASQTPKTQSNSEKSEKRKEQLKTKRRAHRRVRTDLAGSSHEADSGDPIAADPPPGIKPSLAHGLISKSSSDSLASTTHSDAGSAVEPPDRMSPIAEENE